MATLRIDKDTFANEREVVKEERRMRVDNQPYGRLNGDHLRPGVHRASLQAPDDRQHDRSRGGVGRRRPRLLQHLLRAGERDAGAGRRLRLGAGAAAGRPSISAACRRPTQPVPRDIPKEPPQTREKRVTLQEPWPLPAVVVAYHITYDGHPDSYPLHIAVEGAVRRPELAHLQEAGLRQAASRWRRSASANLIEDPNLFYAVAIVQPGHTPEEADRRRSSPSSTS